MLHKCPVCKENFKHNSKQRIYCSRTCYAKTLSSRTKGNKNASWKGNKVSYKGLHTYITRNKGNPPKCVHCGESKKRRVWANVSRKYLRDLNDWIPLCYKCHYEYDKQDWWTESLKGKTPWNKGIEWLEMRGKNHPCWKNNKEQRICLSCKNIFVFVASPSRLLSRGKFCSRSCASRYTILERYRVLRTL